MPFRPNAGDSLVLNEITYRVAEHPVAPGMPYGQEGRQAIVYQLLAEGHSAALKVFKPRFQVPYLVGLTRRLEPFAALPGLEVCRRTVLTPNRQAALLRQFPDLTYAVLMPWVAGPTWSEIMFGGQAISAQESLTLAQGLANVLAAMEQEGLAHCDLSGPNVLLPGLEDKETRRQGDKGTREEVITSRPDHLVTSSPVALVDVEQLYSPNLNRPVALPGGSPGYAHKTASEGLWSTEADRFAGAVIIGEMLGWCDERVREAAWGESYFDPQEMQTDSSQYRVLLQVLRERWGEPVAGLFDHAWQAETLRECAPFGLWLVTLPEQPLATVSSAVHVEQTSLPYGTVPSRVALTGEEASPAPLSPEWESDKGALEDRYLPGESALTPQPPLPLPKDEGRRRKDESEKETFILAPRVPDPLRDPRRGKEAPLSSFILSMAGEGERHAGSPPSPVVSARTGEGAGGEGDLPASAITTPGMGTGESQDRVTPAPGAQPARSSRTRLGSVALAFVTTLMAIGAVAGLILNGVGQNQAGQATVTVTTQAAGFANSPTQGALASNTVEATPSALPMLATATPTAAITYALIVPPTETAGPSVTPSRTTATSTRAVATATKRLTPTRTRTTPILTSTQVSGIGATNTAPSLPPTATLQPQKTTQQPTSTVHPTQPPATTVWPTQPPPTTVRPTQPPGPTVRPTQRS